MANLSVGLPKKEMADSVRTIRTKSATGAVIAGSRRIPALSWRMGDDATDPVRGLAPATSSDDDRATSAVIAG